MKVKELIDLLKTNNLPDEPIASMMWTGNDILPSLLFSPYRVTDDMKKEVKLLSEDEKELILNKFEKDIVSHSDVLAGITIEYLMDKKLKEIE